MQKTKLLLHTCCGPCSTATIETLKEDYDITLYFYNPNITEQDEYELRVKAQKQVANYFGVNIIIAKYNPSSFFEMTDGMEDEAEGGIRCEKCFKLRLEKVAKTAHERNFQAFDTTLTISPHKNYEKVSKIAKELSEKYGVEYLNGNYKKKDGFKRSIEISKELGLYRQKYCGCIYSKWF